MANRMNVLLLVSAFAGVESATRYHTQASWEAAVNQIHKINFGNTSYKVTAATADAHVSEGIRWSATANSWNGFVGSGVGYPLIVSSNEIRHSFTQRWIMDFVDPATGTPRPVAAVAVTVGTSIVNGISMRVEYDNGENLKVWDIADCAGPYNDAGGGFIGIVADQGETIYRAMAGSSAAHSSSQADIQYALGGTAGPPGTCTQPTPAPTTFGSRTPAPTPGGGGASPTPGPGGGASPAPTPHGGGVGPVGAIGDPHMVNVRNQGFDVRRHGTHVLLQIPRAAAPEDTLLRVVGLVRSAAQCKAQFIKQINVTGSWVHQKDHLYDADATSAFSLHRTQGHRFLQAGPVSLRVDFKYSPKGYGYLNLQVLHLGAVVSPIGGILGLDDHSYATKGDCHKRPAANLFLASQRVAIDSTGDEAEDEVEDGMEGSYATASIA